jgi:hypothetical protein
LASCSARCRLFAVGIVMVWVEAAGWLVCRGREEHLQAALCRWNAAHCS